MVPNIRPDTDHADLFSTIIERIPFLNPRVLSCPHNGILAELFASTWQLPSEVNRMNEIADFPIVILPFYFVGLSVRGHPVREPLPAKCAPQGLAPVAIGLGLTLIHLIGLPVTNLSVNPARSTGPVLSGPPLCKGQSPSGLGNL